jgi:hypothetical protein
MSDTKQYDNPKHEAQRTYVERVEKDDASIGLIVGAAFVRGIRQIGYKDTGTALYELIDNAIQAGAQNVHVMFAYEDKSDAKPSGIAVLDDGVGMIPGMIRHAIRWGGTDREDDRTGFGRFGYGLPSASISQGKRFAVYSRIDTGSYHRVGIDLEEISKGRGIENGQVLVDMPETASLPKWVEAYAKEYFDGGVSLRTVVVIDKLDRLSWITTNGLKTHLLPQFGMTYRNLLRSFNLCVEGRAVLPVDPLFLDSGAMYYEVDEDRAEEYPKLNVQVKDRDTGRELGLVKVRYAYLPPTFARRDKTKSATKGNQNPRFDIMKDTNGFVILRNGRQIDVVTRNPWTTFLTYDRNIKVEIDFPATLDELFSVTTSKQQVVLNERMWEILREHNVLRAMEEMRARFKRETKEVAEAADEAPEDVKRASEVAMEETEKFKPPVPVAAEKEEKAKEVLDLTARRKAKEQQIPIEQATERLMSEMEGRPYRVALETHRGGPFYGVTQLGSQRVLAINTAHRFFTDVYRGPDSSPHLRAALEALLWVLADSEIDATGERALFYRSERAHWSTQLDIVLDRLQDVVGDQEEELPDSDEAAGTTEEASP